LGIFPSTEASPGGKPGRYNPFAFNSVWTLVLAPLRFDSRRLTVALASARATLLGQPISRIRLAVAAAVQVQHPSLAIRFSSRLGSPDPLRHIPAEHRVNY
jgi:hypothetical protein